MTSTVAAGNGWLSHGLYRGLASEADLILVQAHDPGVGHTTPTTIARALRWLYQHGPALGVRVVSLSVGGQPVWPLAGNEVDEAIEVLAAEGITVVAAAGNDRQRQLTPPTTAPAALTIGELDDKNSFNHTKVELWHSNYGQLVSGRPKPELAAPRIWVVAPVLPGTDLAHEAVALFAHRAQGGSGIEAVWPP